jgi:OmpA-OmpF porin, OOP family
MRNVRSGFVLPLVVMAAAAPLAGQRTHSYEFSAFGAWTKYDKAFNLANKFGGGARFGYFFSEVVGFEADVEFLPEYPVAVNSTTEPLIGSASLIFNIPSGDRMALYVLGGYSRLDFGNTSPYRFVDGGIHGAVGDHLFLSDKLALRLEARMIYTSSTKAPFTTGSAKHLVASAGLSFFDHGGWKPPDSDHDGVPDKDDACPDTPLGATVDARGCPHDSDGDGVYDGIDKCPDTPMGAKVDATGCPIDSDKDGVPDGIDQCPDTPAGVKVDAKGCPIDTDKDGVPDYLDKCPDTPAGAVVDATGCPIDSDHDGVPDGIDQCPNTPAGAVVDARGCPVDSDGDGVPDGIDKCPNTPPNTKVDATGCPLPAAQVLDSDHDGVPDDRDKCPNTPPNTPVDQNGCMILFREERVAPAAPGAPAPRPTLVLQGVHFQTGRSVLTLDSYAVLDQVAGSLIANPEIRIEIAGYTDSTGSRLVNNRLSNGRALAVQHYLARKGVLPNRMVAHGYGPSNPVASNATPDGRAQNRRVELHKLE